LEELILVKEFILYRGIYIINEIPIKIPIVGQAWWYCL
jgi:hypothetical protein